MTKKKKIIAIVISLCILVAAVGTATAVRFLTKEEPILPPVRVNVSRTEYLNMSDIRFSTAIKDEECDAVALIEIKNWLGETDGVTFYDAKVLKCYKGDLDKKIIIGQGGSSEYTVPGYPLFIYGNKLLVALNGSERETITTDGKKITGTTYGIMNVFYQLIRVEEDNNGNLYFMHYYCLSGGDVNCPIGDTSPLTFHTAEKEIRIQVNQNAREKDPLLPGCTHVYKLSDFEDYLEAVDLN